MALHRLCYNVCCSTNNDLDGSIENFDNGDTQVMIKLISGSMRFIDLRKAFDSVWHPKLINKLNSFGIKGK